VHGGHCRPRCALRIVTAQIVDVTTSKVQIAMPAGECVRQRTDVPASPA